MILAPRYLPRLAATVGLFARYGLLDFARGQGLLSIQGIDAGDEGADAADAQDKAKAFVQRLVVGLVLAGLLIASSQLLPYFRTLGLAGMIIAAGIGVYVLITVLVTDRQNEGRSGKL